MRLGILTFHYAHNYGAVLQAYALKKCLEDMADDVCIVDYRNSAIAGVYGCKIPKRKIFIKTRHIGKILDNIRWNKEIGWMESAWMKQWNEFEEFINITLLEGKTGFDCERIAEELIGYDALIVGSDQIWNRWLTGGFDKMYFLDIPYEGKKIAYAASTSRKEIANYELAYFAEVLQKFDAVSIREHALSKDIRQRIGVDALRCVDPSLLIQREDYDKIAWQGHSLEEQPFLFAYYVTEDRGLSNVAKEVARKKGLELRELHYYQRKWMDSDYQFADIGPAKFLWYIKNAEAICTNSFHGTVLSILYGKELYCVYESNERISSLLQDLSLESRHVDMESVDKEMEHQIDYETVGMKLDTYVSDSKNYLKGALGL